MESRELRQSFLHYFARHQHERVRSSPLVPENDPTLLFTNAGMVQFKDVFTGKETRHPFARHLIAKMCSRRWQTQRSRQRGSHRAPPHLLRDAGQLLLRRLFQSRRHRLRLGLAHALAQARPEPHGGHRVRRRRHAGRRPRRRGPRDLEEGRRLSRRAHHRHGRQGQLLDDGRDRPAGAVLRDSLLPRRSSRCEPLRRGARARRHRLDGDLEPGVHAVRAAVEGLAADAASQAVDRHRRGSRAHVRGDAGREVELRHRSSAPSRGRRGRAGARSATAPR